MQHVGIGAGPLCREIEAKFLRVSLNQTSGFWGHGFGTVLVGLGEEMREASASGWRTIEVGVCRSYL